MRNSPIPFCAPTYWGAHIRTNVLPAVARKGSIVRRSTLLWSVLIYSSCYRSFVVKHRAQDLEDRLKVPNGDPADRDAIQVLEGMELS